jgi:hypothetical protein
MLSLFNSNHHRDSSRLTALRMTSALGYVILSEAKDPYDDPFVFDSSQRFSPFGYDVVAPDGAQNDASYLCRGDWPVAPTSAGSRCVILRGGFPSERHF